MIVMRPSITLLMPVLNEIDGLKHTLPHIDKSLFKQILVMDGGSTDGSQEYALSQGASVATQLRKGLGFAVYDAILAMDSDYVIEFSPDGNCQVKDLPELARLIREGNDLVVVSRYLPPARSFDDNLVSAFGNWLFTLMFRQLGKFPITDALTIFRGFRTDIVKTPEFAKHLHGPVFEPLVTAICLVNGYKIAETPGDEPKRIGGVKKMSPLVNGSYILLTYVRLAWLKLKLLFGLAKAPELPPIGGISAE